MIFICSYKDIKILVQFLFVISSIYFVFIEILQILISLLLVYHWFEQDIKALFPSDYNPFYAGFGNRDTDELSYKKIGIPKGKIFIINPKVF